MIPIDDIRAAAERIAPYVLRTPLIEVDGAWLKLECLQPTGSFKVRGFFARALELTQAERDRGLLTVSAGNGALACAYAAHRLGTRCRVVMYETAPPAKIEGVRRWGAVPVLWPREQVNQWLLDHGWEQDPETFIHPLAELGVLAGHGSLGLELLEQLPDLKRVLVPVGGGGLLSGVASALKAARPEIQVIGVQSSGYPSMPESLAAGEPLRLTPKTIADGTTAPVLPEALERLRELVDTWIVVPEARLKPKIAELAVRAKVVAEGAGVLAYAAFEQVEAGPGTVAIVSGGNLAPAVLAEALTGA